MNATHEFQNSCKKIGLKEFYVIVLGAFEIGMEWLILRLAENFNSRVYMSATQRAFLENIAIGEDSSAPLQRLCKILVDFPAQALIHVLPVEDISMEVSGLDFE